MPYARCRSRHCDCFARLDKVRVARRVRLGDVDRRWQGPQLPLARLGREGRDARVGQRRVERAGRQQLGGEPAEDCADQHRRHEAAVVVEHAEHHGKGRDGGLSDAREVGGGGEEAGRLARDLAVNLEDDLVVEPVPDAGADGDCGRKDAPGHAAPVGEQRGDALDREVVHRRDGTQRVVRRHERLRLVKAGAPRVAVVPVARRGEEEPAAGDPCIGCADGAAQQELDVHAVEEEERPHAAEEPREERHDGGHPKHVEDVVFEGDAVVSLEGGVVPSEHDGGRTRDGYCHDHHLAERLGEATPHLFNGEDDAAERRVEGARDARRAADERRVAQVDASHRPAAVPRRRVEQPADGRQQPLAATQHEDEEGGGDLHRGPLAAARGAAELPEEG
mmetsp:Transcript_29794/g.97752  ORF Transcript_29794/g.97752 Transcript_29794/m.97752 type:complete len:392 (+) Transcript_29794:152-1327(+)